ncbi:MAG: hypothetical protein HIU89_17455 [Proteobacteria bacterium]|nr:hypothetical protein [Pseudomonadota bacterium]
MTSTKPLLTAIAASLVLATAGVSTTTVCAQPQKQETIYGSQLMTQHERDEYRAKLREAKTLREREHLRAEHHKQMQERARERGVTLPDNPPAQRMHQGLSPGAGMGPGAGRGPGAGLGGGGKP